jgi:lipid-binding SYLF domain-containing protein
MKIAMLLALSVLLHAGDLAAQKTSKEKKLVIDCDEARKDFIATDRLMQPLFERSYGYAIFPNVDKGGFIVGGAVGSGGVYEGGKPIGTAKLTQVTAGFQAGGQSYREVVFFEDRQALERFKKDEVEFSAGVSAVVAREGAAANPKYRDGVLIFIQVKGGLMLEASMGGQKFNFKAF